jgi:3-oxoadipate enol-lactonase
MQSECALADVNGTRLAYEVAGEGPAVVLLHGLTLDLRMWDDQFASLAAHHCVVRYDLRGFGRSDPPHGGEPYSHADDLRALLDVLGIERAAVVGLSLGGMLAVEFALTYPGAIRALVLADAAVSGFTFGPPMSDVLGELYRAARAESGAVAREGWLGSALFGYSQTLPDVAARLRTMVAEYSLWHMLHRDPRLPFEPPAIDRLAEISAPTLVIVGEHDLPDFHSIAGILSSNIPGARLAVLPNAGHMSNMDNPSAFNDLTQAFLAEIAE